MASKRKRVVLSLADKLEIIEHSDKGVAGKLLAEMYGVGQSTISDIKKSKPKLLNFMSVLENEDRSPSRKSMKAATNKDLEDVVFKWFLQQRSMGNPISGPILCEKAKISAEKLGCSSFKASNGWLRNFKSRHGLGLSRQKLSADNFLAEDFIGKEIKVVAGSYDPEFLYNSNETGLAWKALPKTTLASKGECSASGHNIMKDRVTVLTCANSTGSHKIPLLLIGKSKRPRAFANVEKKLPLFYKNHPNAWMSAAAFTEWYDEIFIPEVEKHQKSLGKEGSKVLLIADGAPTHLTEELLERGNGQFKTIFFPPNVTSLLQPMDQSAIETMKRLYRRQLLRKLSVESEDEESVLANYQKINLEDCAYMVAEAWNLVKAVTLRRAWNKLKGISTKEEEEKEIEAQENGREETGEDQNDVSLEEFLNILLKIPGCTEVSAEDIGEWMACDSSEPGFQILNDDELIESVREKSVKEEDDLNVEVEADTGPSASEAFAGLETALKWMERQPECDHLQLLTVKQVRDLAAEKRMSAFKQLTLTEMFSKQ